MDIQGVNLLNLHFEHLIGELIFYIGKSCCENYLGFSSPIWPC